MERKGLLTCLTALQVITFLSCNLIGRSTKTGVEVGDLITLRPGSEVYVSLAEFTYQVLCQPQNGEVFEVLAVDGQGTNGDKGYFFHRVKSRAETGTTDCAGKGSGHIYHNDIKDTISTVSQTLPNYRQWERSIPPITLRPLPHRQSPV